MMTRTVKQLLDLGGRVALVTGASRGLGFQMAEALGEMGAKIAITARKRPELDEAVAQLRKLGIEAAAWTCDMASKDEVVPTAEKVLAHYGQVDILVNNAGISWGAPAEDHPIEAWEKVIGVNLSSVFILTQCLAKRSMIPARRGRIVNIASVAGITGQDPRIMMTAAYNAAKGGLVNLTRQLAAEWGRYGITVNAICPGFFPTKLAAVPIERAGDFIRDLTPTGRLGNDEDLKGLAVLLASDAASHISGQAIAVDGGASAI
jgi:NAD(P)-dependent dehydrogenase (short-subunit alcohol dehydrogenase family)